MEIKISASNLAKLDGKCKMFFDISVDGVFIMKGFKLVDGNNGMFVSNPREKSGEQWFDRVIWLDSAKKQELEQMAIQHYGKIIGGNK